MIRFMVHTPVNLRRRMMDYVKGNLPDLEKRIGDKIMLYMPHDPEYEAYCGEEWLAPSVERGNVPDVILTHATDFASLKSRLDNNLFSNLAGRYEKQNPVRDELSMITDPMGIFYPVCVTPLVMLYNSNNVKEHELKHSWADLFNKKFNVIFPGRDKPLTRAAGAFLLQRFPEEFPEFEKRVVYEGYPSDVVKAVVSGEYDIAMSIFSFAMMANSRGIAINPTQEGYIPLPQVLVWKQGADERLTAIADLLMSEEMQNFLSDQGSLPARKGVPMGDISRDNTQLKNWQGWDTYIEEVAGFDKFSM